MGWAKRSTKPIPRVSSPTQTFGFDDYSGGFDSFLSNDTMPNKPKGNLWRLAQDARIVTLGEYETRKGADYHSDAAGETQDDSEESTTGAADQTFSDTKRIAQKFTTASAGRLARIDVRLRNSDSGSGTILVELWSNSGGEPDELLARSSIASSDVTSSYAYYSARFINTPDSLTTATDYWIVVYIQSVASGTYDWSSTTNSTDALVSTDSGVTWATQSFSMNFKEFYATDGGTKGLHRAYKSDGTKKTLFVQGTTLYSVDDVTGALTTVKTGLSASATDYRFVTVNDIVYYVNGYDGYRKWNFTTESQVSATNYTHIALHKGLMFLVDKNDPNKIVYSNFADYETFTSTDFIYAPAPKTGDPVTSLVPLNGYMLIFTSDNKLILSGDDNATFSLDEAPDQKGTYRQETTCVDKDFVYYLGNDGVYRSNGSEAKLLSTNIYEDILRLPNPESSVINVNKGRLYLWVRPSGSDANHNCYVWNLNYGDEVVESYDTETTISRAVTAYNDNNAMMIANSEIGQVYWQELASNDYTNLGGDINFMLQGHYNPYGDPSVLKEIRYWNPRFEAQSGSYTISCEYAYDLRENWTVYQSPNVQGAGDIWGSGIIWGAFTWGSTAELQSHLYIPGEYRRIAVRYKHYATRQPHTFLGHTQKVEFRRMR